MTEVTRTMQEWIDVLHYDPVANPDGWRRGDGVTPETPITRSDFEDRYNASTIKMVGPKD